MRAGLLLLMFLLAAAPLAAEPPDTTSLEEYLREPSTPDGIGARARGYLYQRLDVRDPDGVRELLSAMAAHPEWEGWITPRELLLARIYAVEPLVTRDPMLGALLAQAPLRPRARVGVLREELLTMEQTVVRGGLAPLSERYLRAGLDSVELRFLNLLIDHLLVKGYRARSELNREVDRFIEEAPTSPLAALAATYLRYPYREERFGLAFGAGYILGRFLGPVSDRFSYLHGATLGGELYLDRVTIVGGLGFGTARLSSGFTAAGEAWPAGNAPIVLGSLLAGWELRHGRLAITPLAGLAFQSIRSPGEQTPESRLPSTGGRVGVELGALVGYRIPFDRGTHIDLRFRLGWSSTSAGEYDPAFRGSSYFAGLGFALVHRPYLSVW